MRYPEPVHLVAARRSPIGRFGGGLLPLGAADLALTVAEAVVPEALRPHLDQVILGQVLPAGGGMNVARQVGLRLGAPVSAPAFTINQVCGSGLKALTLAADAVTLGTAGLVLAGGVEAMSRAPHYARDQRWGKKLGDAPLADAIVADGLTDPVLGIGMAETAERVAAAAGITRAAQDAFALRSQQRAAAAAANFSREIVPVHAGRQTVAADEHPRPGTTLEQLAQLPPAFRRDGTVTAGNASGLNDGAALLLIAGAAAVARHGLIPRARLVASAEVGCDPATMGLGPVPAVRRLLAATGWSLGEVDVVELNEAFAAQALACARELGIAEDRLNPRGGAIALGHPLGATGARLVVTLLHTLEDLGARRGIAALCVGGGMGLAVAVER